ncbi:GNAT family N-acetyltransferase [Roseovarius sp. MMSF_3281]|uniref:GNAT family N-acetyltransferase n=1 Tax=Roseovarius sp. MMSF_3281 TaxID=3046694 RepID=UPI00273E23B3|nr:GNAT family N-acetyltransferase [Roseovarius sp. MMSF_3281]
MSEASAQTPPHEALEIRPLGPEHVAGALALSRQVGWPHRKEDWGLALAVSEGVVATEGDKVTGTACCSRFGAVSLLNMIIVDEAMRGRGLGRQLMQAVMALVAGGEMRLVATREGLPLYEKLGFVATHEIRQHQGIARSTEPELSIVAGTVADIGQLAEMDRQASGLERRGLLELIAAEGQVLLAENGFALLREFGRGHVVGPVVAKDAATARALITEAARRTAGGFLRIDLPEAAGLSEFVTALGLDHAGGGTAMALAPAPADTGDYKTYALVSQALG